MARTCDSMVRVRIDSKTKEKAAHVLDKMGLTVSDAVRMLLVRVAEEGRFPFDLKVPNAKEERTKYSGATFFERLLAKTQPRFGLERPAGNYPPFGGRGLRKDGRRLSIYRRFLQALAQGNVISRVV